MRTGTEGDAGLGRDDRHCGHSRSLSGIRLISNSVYCILILIVALTNDKQSGNVETNQSTNRLAAFLNAVDIQTHYFNS